VFNRIYRSKHRILLAILTDLITALGEFDLLAVGTSWTDEQRSCLAL
jgi:hypothetical protein